MSADMMRAMLSYIANLRAAGPLQTKREREAATEVAERLGFESHHDRQKNWDTLKCVAHVAGEGRDGPVLDAGSGSKAVVLRWLSKLGYKDLYACDLVPANAKALEALGIAFTQQDLTATTYDDQFFQAVTSISVVEHNVPLDKFFREMHRILRPKGLLLISTDYWSEPIDCSGIYPYGEEAGEMKVFDEAGIRALIETAQSAGFEPCETPTFATTERAVRWDRVDRDYTFYFLALRRSA